MCNEPLPNLGGLVMHTWLKERGLVTGVKHNAPNCQLQEHKNIGSTRKKSLNQTEPSCTL